MACLGLFGAVFSKDRRVKRGGMKQEWKKVRRLLVNVTPKSCKLLDDEDDFGEDFVREMLVADALEDAAETRAMCVPRDGLSTGPKGAPSRIESIFNTSPACSSKQEKSLKAGSGSKKAAKLDKCVHKQATRRANTRAASTVLQQPIQKPTAPVSSIAGPKQEGDMQAAEFGKTGTVANTIDCQPAAKKWRHARKNKFVVDICKPDRQKLRLYLKRGHADDAEFGKLARRWHKYDASKRLAKLQNLQLPACIFQCCSADKKSCLCDKAAAVRFFAKVCGKTSLECAMLFLSQQRNRQYTQGLSLPHPHK